jgi:hypothetical protein
MLAERQSAQPPRALPLNVLLFIVDCDFVGCAALSRLNRRGQGQHHPLVGDGACRMTNDLAVFLKFSFNGRTIDLLQRYRVKRRGTRPRVVLAVISQCR